MHEGFLSKRYPWDKANSVFQSSHDHLDANTFYLYKGKSDLASEKQIYGINDTRFHNTILVDNKNQYNPNEKAIGNTDGIIKGVYESPDINYLCSDATGRYRYGSGDPDGITSALMISEFTRRVLFIKPSYLVMVDNLKISDSTSL